jgi:hypothetical protein
MLCIQGNHCLSCLNISLPFPLKYFGRWSHALRGVAGNPLEFYRKLHLELPESGIFLELSLEG